MNTHRSWGGVRSFTLIEIMITLVITGVLATIAIPAYQNFIEDGRAMMCEENLGALKPELEMYIVEHNVVPGDTSLLPRERIEKALARARANAGWKEKLVLFLDEQSDRGCAFADMVQELAHGNLGILVCPSDPRRKQASVVSYGVNEILVGMNKDTFMAQADTVELIGDSVTPTYSSLGNEVSAQRHKHIGNVLSGSFIAPAKYANAITKGGWITKNGQGYLIEVLKYKEKTVLSTVTSKSDRKKQINDIWHKWK